MIGNLNLLFAIRDHVPDCHLVKLGTMGEYGQPNIDIEEGYIEIEHKGRKDTLPFPKLPASLYHCSKVHDSTNIHFACRTWGLRATDLNQGVVYGIETEETARRRAPDHPLRLRRDLRHRAQPLLPAGGDRPPADRLRRRRPDPRLPQHPRHAAAASSWRSTNPAERGEFRVFNQFTEQFSVLELAELVKHAGEHLGYSVEIQHCENPRVEKEEHYYNAIHTKLLDLGLEPTLLGEELVESMIHAIERHKGRRDRELDRPAHPLEPGQVACGGEIACWPGIGPLVPSPSPMRAADALMESLKAEGVEHVFGIPGGANLPTYDALVDAGFRHIQVRHEQGGGHAAEGYAKASGRVGVAFATSGPGATNLVTAIADAMMDSVPTVFVTGQVRTELIGTDGFQEADILGATLPFVKHSFQVTDPRQIPEYVHEAFHVASTGRPGPVLLDIPQDLSRADIDYAPRTEPVELAGYKPSTEGNIKQIRIAAKALANARRPILYTGGGVVNANASEELRELAASDRFPVTSTLMGLGAFPASGESWLGMLGMHGTFTANWAMDKADLIVAIGARFDDRITGKLAEFAPHAKVIHIDIDPAEISKNVGAHIPIVGDVKLVLPKLTREYRALQTDSLAPRRLVEAAARLAGGAPAALRARQGRRDQAAVHDRGDAPGDAGRRDRHLRRRPAPDVGGAVLRLRASRAAGSTPAGWGRWASACRRRSAPRSPAPTSTSSAWPATAA